MASKVNSTAILIGICVLCHAIWLDGRTNAAKIGDKTVSCGGTYDSAPGEINHPVTSGSYYNSNEICSWIISASLPLAFYFSKFNMEDHYDHVSIRDGGSIGSPLIEELTGKSLHYNFTTAGDAHIQFESDPSVVGNGFVLHWRVYSAEDQCKDKNGVCVQTGYRCDGTFEMIQNSCDDRCACCVPDDTGAPLTEAPLSEHISDGDCLDGVIVADQCLKFSTEELSWEDAKERCLSQNARLAILNDPGQFLTYTRANYRGNRFWLGASDIANEGEFVWTNGQALGDQFPWPSYRSKHNRGNIDCLSWGFKNSFNDSNCRKSFRFVCEH